MASDAVPQFDDAAAERLKAAKDDLAAAQRDVDRALGELKASARADKSMIGDALRSALERVSNARSRLNEAVNLGETS